APKMATHPATKNPASAIRSNLVVCIAVSFEPVYRHGPRGLTILPSIRRFRRGPEEAIAKFGSGIASHIARSLSPGRPLRAGPLLHAATCRRQYAAGALS